MRIVALCGLRGAGKDSVADVLERRHGFRRFSFAGKLKDVVSALFGWDRELLDGRTEASRRWREQEDRWWGERLDMPGLTPRAALQQIGTDALRGWHEEIWLAAAERSLAQLMSESAGGGGVVVTDCRFRNEISMLRHMGASVVHVRRGPLPPWLASWMERAELPDPAKHHVSEWEWAQDPTLLTELDNSGTLEELPDAVDAMLRL
jgi:hypothetical protein